MNQLKSFANLNDEDMALVERCLEDIAPQWAAITDMTQANQI